MSVEDLQKALQKLRNVELRHAIRGVDAEQVRELLDEAAASLVTAVREQNELRREVERLRATSDEDAVGTALLVATRTGERIIAQAREKATAIIAEAEAQASAQEHDSAPAETDAALADARRELARLENEAVQARSLVADTERRAVEMIQRALDELESPRDAGRDGADLRGALKPAVSAAEIVAD